MRVLVTGSSGLVGRYVMRALRDLDHVIGIDIANGTDCLDFFRKDTTHFDVAIHCAATIGGRKGIDHSPLVVATNLALDSLFFHWLERTHVAQAIYFSSSAVYPVALQEAIHSWMGVTTALREEFADLSLNHFGMPDKTYGWCKLTGEYLALHSSSKVTVVRPFSGTGEGQSLDYPMPAFIDRAKRRADPFEVWGDGTQVRDWIHISDVVDGALLAMHQGIPGPVNLCTGRGVSFNQLAGMITKAVGYSPRIEYKPDAPRGVQCRVGDPTKMREFFTPKISLEETIDRMLCNTKES